MATNRNASAIVPRYDIKKIAEKMNRSVEDTIDRVLKRLCMIGERCVAIARNNGDYNDVTGNLRSSIGYVVLYNGAEYRKSIIEPTNVAPGERLVKRTRKDGTQHLVKQKIGGDGSEGAKQATELLDKLKSKYPRGCVLIVCAGMEYAAYVENVHGKRVLVDAKLKAEQLADKWFGKRSRK